MMISYLLFMIERSWDQLIPHQHISDLLDLVAFGQLAFGLQVQNFLHTLLEKNVVGTFHSALEVQIN